MEPLVNRSLSLFEIMRGSTRKHYAVLKRIIPLIILLVVVKDLYIYLGGMPQTLWLKLPIEIVMGVLMLALWAMILVAANDVLHNTPRSLKGLYDLVMPRLPKVILCILFYIAALVLVWGVTVGIIHLTMRHETHHTGWVGILIVFVLGFIYLCFIMQVFLAHVLFALGAIPFWKTVRESVLLAQQNWKHLLALYGGLFAILVLGSPDTLHGHLLAHYYLTAPFDLVMFSILLPLYVNMILYTIDSLRAECA